MTFCTRPLRGVQVIHLKRALWLSHSARAGVNLDCRNTPSYNTLYVKGIGNHGHPLEAHEHSVHDRWPRLHRCQVERHACDLYEGRAAVRQWAITALPQSRPSPARFSIDHRRNIETTLPGH